MKIQLNDNEVKMAECIGKWRGENDRKAGVHSPIRDTEQSVAVDIKGALGEIAFAKAFNLYPDLSTEPGGSDFTLSNGWTVDVKTTHWEAGELRAKLSTKLGVSDVYALVVGFERNYRIVGWAAEKLLLCEKNINHKFHCYSLPQDQLLEMYRICPS